MVPGDELYKRHVRSFDLPDRLYCWLYRGLFQRGLPWHGLLLAIFRSKRLLLADTSKNDSFRIIGNISRPEKENVIRPIRFARIKS